MKRVFHHLAATSTVVVVLLLSAAAPAAAHPYVHGGELPVDSLATMDLDLAHGCDPGHAGDEEITTEVAIEVPEWLRIVEVEDHPGWDVEIARDDDGAAEVVSFHDDGAQERAPVFTLDVVATGEVGETRYLGVFQGCDDTSHRWIGTDEEPADEPAVGVTLTEADPSSPPPPPEAADDDAADDAPDDVGVADDAADDVGVADDATDAEDTDVDDAGTPDEDPDTAAGEDADALAVDDTDDAGSPTTGLVAVMIAAIAAVAGFVVVRRLRGR